MSKSKYVDFLEGVLIGGSLGAAATFLFGTKKGKELQQKVVKKCRALEHKAERYVNNAKKAVKGPMSKRLKRLVKKTVKKTAFKTTRRKSPKRARR